MSCLIVFHSLTHAQIAADLLRRNGISAVLVKPPTTLGRGSCAYGLLLKDSVLPAALELLGKTNRKPLGIFQAAHGGWQEVRL